MIERWVQKVSARTPEGRAEKLCKINRLPLAHDNKQVNDDCSYFKPLFENKNTDLREQRLNTNMKHNLESNL
jgi:hypothetical protein